MAMARDIRHKIKQRTPPTIEGQIVQAFRNLGGVTTIVDIVKEIKGFDENADETQIRITFLELVGVGMIQLLTGEYRGKWELSGNLAFPNSGTDQAPSQPEDAH